MLKLRLLVLAPEFPLSRFEVGPTIYISKNSLSDASVTPDTSEGLSALEYDLHLFSFLWFWYMRGKIKLTFTFNKTRVGRSILNKILRVFLVT